MKAYLWSDGEPPPTTRRARWRRFAERHLPRVVIYLMVATLVAVVLDPPKGGAIPTGDFGVPLGLFGRRAGRGASPVGYVGYRFHFAMEPCISVRPETTILYRVLQRHLQRRREPDREHHCPVPAPARCSARAAPSDRAKLRASAGAARHRQSDARGDCSIYRRTGLFDGTPGNSGQNPQPRGGQVIREDDGARRRRVIPRLDEGYHHPLRYTCDWH